MIDGKRLRQLREASGYTREQFAEKIDLGTTQLTRYERGESDATGNVLARIAKVLGVSADYLLGITDEPLPNTDSGLTPEEIALIAARRRKDYREAIKLLVSDE
jgi:transcriptional regulator with XRE-family HTH domain